MVLYDYFRSTASYRVRIALHLKGIECALEEVHLVQDGGQQHSDSYQAINPQQRVPCLVDGDVVIMQSLAIIDYLQQKYPQPSLYSGDCVLDARIRSMAHIVACDIHPLNNLSVLQYLQYELDCSDEQKRSWYHHWLRQGFDAIEAMLPQGASFCVGNEVSLADVCLVPQVYNADRFEFDMSDYPRIRAVQQHCMTLPAFAETAP